MSDRYTIWRAPMVHDRPEILPVRWWRDDADRYRSRGEPAPSRCGFDPSKLPDADRNREWERMAYEHALLLVPLEFKALEPLDPIADIKMTFKQPLIAVPPPLWMVFGGKDDI